MTGAETSIFWTLAGTFSHLAGACIAAMVAVLIFARRARFGQAGDAIIASLVLTAVWCLSSAALGPEVLVSGMAEVLRNLAYIFVLYRLFAGDGRHESVAQVQPVLGALAFAGFLQCAMMAVQWRQGVEFAANELLFHLGVLLRMLAAVGGLVLVHNLYAGAVGKARAALRWPAAALALAWGFDLNLYTIAYLLDRWPSELAALRGLIVAGYALLLWLGTAAERDAMRFRPSRAVAFQSFSLLVIGAYLITMVGVSQWLSLAGGDYSRLLQFGFLIAASAVAVILLPSRRLRGWFRVSLAKHLFQHRYDYRAEWLRFTATMGRGGDDSTSLYERAVRAVADITDSPAGLLLAPGDNGELTLAARWQWPTAEIPAEALGSAAIAFFENRGFIVDLDEVRTGQQRQGEAAIVPGWLIDDPRAWAMVPLLHYDRLVGVVILARPLSVRRLDWEDLDLLRVIGQQLASYLAENAGQAALTEANQFDDFHRRIAFVMHDIKNLASQMALLARNAERHADNPAFRADMLVTLRNSTDKLNALLARLSRYGGPNIDALAEVQGHEVIAAAADRFRVCHNVIVAQVQECAVAADAESLEQVLIHLVQNAIDASPEGTPVFLSGTLEGLQYRIEVLDSGSGMSPDFVRNKLFKPFVSTKQGGFGIGAYEARELVRAMRGRLDVESREGLGSRFILRLPIFAASDLLQSLNSQSVKVA